MLRIVVVGLLLISSSAFSATFSGVVEGKKGEPIADAIVSLMPANRDHLPATGSIIPDAKMDQIDKQYVPYDLPVRLGTQVRFPNKDNIKHHVYSFSPAKRFELKLYAGVNAKPIMFDKAGVVALGCNIHDWMLGYIYVLETPFFAKTDKDGRLQINDLPNDHYVASVWHPRIRGKVKKHDQRISLQEVDAGSATFSIKLKRERRKRRTPDFEEEVY